jgi:WD40 repeat protein
MQHELWASAPSQNEGFFSVAFSPDGSLIAAGSDTGQVILFRAETATILQSYQVYPSKRSSYQFPVRSVAISHDNELLLTSGSEGVKLWHLPDGRLVKFFSRDSTPGLNNHPCCGLFSADDTKILTFPPVEGAMIPTYDVWTLDSRLRTPRLVQHNPTPVFAVFFESSAQATSFAVSADTRVLAWGGGVRQPEEYLDTWMARLQNDPRIVVWRLDEPEPAYTLIGHRHNVEDLAFSPDGKLLASVSRDRTLRVWRLSN